MKYHVGDMVLVQGKVTQLDIRDYSLRLEFEDEVSAWFGEHEIFELPKPEKTYEQGLEDAWEFMKKCFYAYSAKECEEIFGKVIVEHIVMTYTPQEALAKLKAYEENSKIKMGDVVIASRNNYTTTGVFYGETEKEYWILDPSCQVPQSLSKGWKLKKTGKHIDIESLLEQIKGDANE